jgi:hypothetical protein
MEDIRFAQALFNFESTYADELSIKEGQILQVLYNINQDWIYAKTLIQNDASNQHGSMGILPINFVRILNLPDELFENDSKFQLYLATDSFNFSQPGDLEFQKGFF